MAGEEPELNAEYDNHVFMVPSFNCTPVFADLSNYEALLIDSGYYTMGRAYRLINRCAL